MRILYVTNPMPPTGCGVAQFGRLQAQALEGAGQEVTIWEVVYPTYLPPWADNWDVIHLNFHPITIGHIQSQHLPAYWTAPGAPKKFPLFSAHFHEYDPRWDKGGSEAPELWTSDRVKVKFSSEVNTGKILFPIPIPDYSPKLNLWQHSLVPTIGFTGLRRDGQDRVAQVCEVNGWLLRPNTEWLPLEKEIDRLSRCYLNVVHMHGGYSGQSSAVCTAVAARRPLLINSNRMLTTVWNQHVELGGQQLYRDDDIEAGIKLILHDMSQGTERLPDRLYTEHCWSKRIHDVIKIWEDYLQCES